AVAAKGRKSKIAPSPQGSSASGSSAPESTATTAPRTYSISQTGVSSATVSPPKMKSSATPTETPSARLTRKSAAATGLTGRGSTPSSGEIASRGSEKSAKLNSQRPTISATKMPTKPTG